MNVVSWRNAVFPSFTLDIGARAQGIDYFLEGSVRRYGGRVRVAVSLVDARRDVQTWGDTYEREIAESVPTQIEIASSISLAVIGQISSAS